jgi:hypothetical protein
MAKKQHQAEIKQDMSLEEARAYRLANYKPQKALLTSQQKRAQFKVFWTQSRKKYGRPRTLEDVLWIHLKAIGCDEPEKFEEGIAHFGLKKQESR